MKSQIRFLLFGLALVTLTFISPTLATVSGFQNLGDPPGIASLSGASSPSLVATSVQLHKLTASDAAVNDIFGSSVAISGNTAIVGAYRNADAGANSGSAYLFDVITGDQIAKLTASDAKAEDWFGYSVAVSGNYAIVGAHQDDDGGTNSGSAYLFDAQTGAQIAKLAAADADVSDYFGYAVAVSGTIAIVGAWGDDDADSTAGSAYLFDFNDLSGIKQIKLIALDAGWNDQFGRSVALSGTTAIVGAPFDDDAGNNSGSAYLYDFSHPSGIIVERKLTAADAEAYDRFGDAVAIDGNTAVVGAPYDDDAASDSGSAYVFDANTGQQLFKLTPADAAEDDWFGRSVAVSGNYALVGASGDDDDGDRSGSAYLFDLTTGTQVAKLTASDAASQDNFGFSVALSGDTSLVGALWDSDAGAKSGSAYLFAPADTDGDGLPDLWETDGIDFDADGAVDINLPGLGADPNHKDLFVEVDAMAGRAPAPATLGRVVAAFAAAPNDLVDNPDGRDGITLHIQLDETDVNLAPWPNAFDDFDAVKADRFGTPAQRAHPNWENIKSAKLLAYRYCIFADTYSGTKSSGLAELPGNDFIVTLGGWHPPGGTPNQQAGTFMHEFGHTLGLRHGGVDDIHHKPNYHSVMNYTWQVPFPQYPASWVLDYSRAVWPALDESDLAEAPGIGGHAGHRLPVGPPLPTFVNQLIDESGPVDWNRDGNANDANVAADINRIRSSQPASPNEVLTGFCDWSNLRYSFRGDINFQDGVHIHTTINTEMTLEIFHEIGCTPGDFDCDSDVDLADLGFLSLHWLDMPCDGAALEQSDWCLGADLSRNGKVDLPDLALFADYWLEHAQQ
jgi:hypothetical protein